METLTESDLRRCNGTEKYHRLCMLAPSVLFTDGCKMVAEKGQAYWLMDLIASHIGQRKFRCHEFLCIKFVKLSADCKNQAKVTIEDGNDNILAQQLVPYTDFPLDKITFFASIGALGPEASKVYRIVMLPSEN